MGIFAKEPVVVIALVTSVLVMLVQFGVPITGEQQDAIRNVITAVLAVAAVWAARANVASPATLRAANTSLKEVEQVADEKVKAHFVVRGPDADMVRQASADRDAAHQDTR